MRLILERVQVIQSAGGGQSAHSLTFSRYCGISLDYLSRGQVLGSDRGEPDANRTVHLR